MKHWMRYFLPGVIAVMCTVAAQAQFYKLHGADVGVAATGQFTTSITDQTTGSSGQLLAHQATTDSPGVLFTLRDHPVSWAGIELNYQYTKFSNRYFLPSAPRTPAFLSTNMHEATAAYLFHLNLHRIKPYMAIGGGALDFQPIKADSNQWRGTGLIDIGLDMQTHSNLGFRIGARDLLYRAPNFNNAALSSSRWVSTEEPYGGVYIRF